MVSAVSTFEGNSDLRWFKASFSYSSLDDQETQGARGSISSFGLVVDSVGSTTIHLPGLVENELLLVDLFRRKLAGNIRKQLFLTPKSRDFRWMLPSIMGCSICCSRSTFDCFFNLVGLLDSPVNISIAPFLLKIPVFSGLSHIYTRKSLLVGFHQTHHCFKRSNVRRWLV